MSKKELSNSGINWDLYINPNVSMNCPHLLPCGICGITNQYCPLKNSEPTWLSNEVKTSKITDTINFDCCEEKKND